MRLALFLILLSMPLIELALLIKLGQWIGFWPTLGVVIGTALLGAGVLHRQGFAALNRAAAMTRGGRQPLEPALDGMFLMLAGVLLLLPGLLTDIAGVLLLVPPLRRAVAHWGFARLMRVATFEMHVSRAGAHRRGEPSAAGREPGGPGVGEAPGASTAGPAASGPRPVGLAPGRPPRDEDAGQIIEGDFQRIDERDRPRN